MADARQAIAALPVAHQYTALSLADKLRSISASLAGAAELGAKTSHRLHALANSEAAKIDDADPTNGKSEAALRSVALLTKVANEAAAPGMGLIAASKGVRSMDDPETEGGLASRMRKQRAIDGV